MKFDVIRLKTPIKKNGKQDVGGSWSEYRYRNSQTMRCTFYSQHGGGYSLAQD